MLGLSSRILNFSSTGQAHTFNCLFCIKLICVTHTVRSLCLMRMFKTPLSILENRISEAVAFFSGPIFQRKIIQPEVLADHCLFKRLSSLHRSWLILKPDGKTKTGTSFGVQKEASLAKALSFLSATRVKNIFIVNHQECLLAVTAIYAVFVSMKVPSTPQMTPCRQEMCFSILQ